MATAFRSLWRRPAVPAVVVVTLGLGIGAAALIFSVFDGVLFSRLPFPRADRLVTVTETVTRDGVAERRSFSFPDFGDLRRGTESFVSLGAYDLTGVNLLAGGSSFRVRAEQVTASYFTTLGTPAHLGRTFAVNGGERRTVLSHGLWQRTFGGDADVVGRTVLIDGEAHVVEGVMPPAFAGLSTGGVDLWLPLERVDARALEARGNRFLGVVGRLRPDVTVARARGETQAVFARIMAARSISGYGADVLDLRADLLGDLRGRVTLLLAAVAFMLAIAVTNLANLLLARAMRQRRETAMRLALGASTAAVLGRAFAELLVLGFLGAALALVLCAWGLDLLLALMPLTLPGFVSVEIDARVIAFTFALAATISLALAALVAVSRPRGDLRAALVGNELAGGTGAQRRFRAAMIVSQVALALLLLIGAGATIRAFVSLQQVALGFQDRDLILFRYDFTDRSDDPDAAAIRARALAERVAAVPGVEAVGIASDSPFEGFDDATIVASETMSFDPDAVYGGAVRTYRHRVDPGTFRALGIPLLAGRAFEPHDLRSEPDVAIVSRTLAERLWPGEDPIGKRLLRGQPLATGDDPESARWYRVVGVAADVRFRYLVARPGQPADPDLYLPLRPEDTVAAGMIVRAPAAAIPAVRDAAASFDRAVPIFGLTTMDERLGGRRAEPRFSAVLMGAFAGLAMVLVGIGIYAVVSFVVAGRTREIGLRMALGARRSLVRRMVVREGMRLVAAGIAIGLLGALLLVRLPAVSVQLFDGDWWTLALLGVSILAAIAALGCYLPARRASSVDPLRALRAD